MSNDGQEERQKEQNEQEVQETQEVKKRMQSGWAVHKDGYLQVMVDMVDVYRGIGILREAEQYLVDLLVIKRAEMKKAEADRKAIIEGKDPLAREAIKNKSFFKKTFMK